MLSVTEFHESLYRAIDKQNSRKEMIQDYQSYLSHGEKWRKHKYIAIENGRYIYPDDVKKKEQRNEGKSAGYAAAAKAASKPTTSGTKNPTVGASQVEVAEPDRQKLNQNLSKFEEDFINWYRTFDTDDYNSIASRKELFDEGMKRYQDKLVDILRDYSKNSLNWPIELREEPIGFYLQKLIDKSKGKDSAKSRMYDREKNQAIKNSMKHSAFSMSDEEFYRYTGKNVATT